jgi:hypothetical protein
MYIIKNIENYYKMRTIYKERVPFIPYFSMNDKQYMLFLQNYIMFFNNTSYI